MSPAHLNYRIIKNEFIIQFDFNNGLNNIGQDSSKETTQVPKLAKRAGAVGDAPKNNRFRKAVKQVMNTSAFVDSLRKEAKKIGIQMTVARTYDSDIMQGAQITLTKLSRINLIKS
jgi:hypothetical protein